MSVIVSSVQDMTVISNLKLTLGSWRKTTHTCASRKIL